MARPGNPREKILATAARLFYEQGYNSTGINQVLEEAGVAKASLYAHFGSKDELGLAYLKAARAAWFSAFNAALEKKKTAAEKLTGAFEFLEQNLPQQSFRGCRFINMLVETNDTSTAMKQEILVHKQKLRKVFIQLVSAAAPQLKPRQAELTGSTAYLLFEGAIMESKVYHDLWPVKVAKKTVRLLITSSSTPHP